MQNKFDKGDKVLANNTDQPVMKVVGLAMRGDFPRYTTPGDIYTCEWYVRGAIHKEEFHESELTLINEEVQLLIDECKELLSEKGKEASTAEEVSKVRLRAMEINAFQDLYNKRERNPLHEAEVNRNFKRGILSIMEQIKNI